WDQHVDRSGPGARVARDRRGTRRGAAGESRSRADGSVARPRASGARVVHAATRARTQGGSAGGPSDADVDAGQDAIGQRTRARRPVDAVARRAIEARAAAASRARPALHDHAAIVEEW